MADEAAEFEGGDESGDGFAEDEVVWDIVVVVVVVRFLLVVFGVGCCWRQRAFRVASVEDLFQIVRYEIGTLQ